MQHQSEFSASNLAGPSTVPSGPRITLKIPAVSQISTEPLPPIQTPVDLGTPAPVEDSQLLGKAKKRRIPDWARDGADGRPSSLDLLLEWMTIPRNIDKWRNGFMGIKQKDAARLCADWLASRGVPTPRDAESCNFKIRSLFESWKKAQDYKHTTGNGGGATAVIRAEQSGIQADIDDAVIRLERSVKSLCPHWDQLDPIFSDRDGGHAALRADSGSSLNPAVATLMAAMQQSSAPPETQPDIDWPFSDREHDPEGLETSPPPSMAPSTASERRGSIRSLEASSTTPSISDRNHRKRRQPGNDFDFGADLLRRDDEYRSSKLAKLEEANVIQARKVRAHVGKAIIEAAKILQDLDPARSWDDCKSEARRELGMADE